MINVPDNIGLGIATIGDYMLMLLIAVTVVY